MRSDVIKKGFERAPHRSLLKATGVTDADMGKPFIAVCNSFVEIIPGHVHLNRVGRYVKECIREAGGVAFEFNTIGVDDGIAMGHGGMLYSLPSREIIADSVETIGGLVGEADAGNRLEETRAALAELDDLESGVS